MTEVAEALIEQKLPNGKLIDKQTALDGLTRVIPMLNHGFCDEYEVIKDDKKLNHIAFVIHKGNLFIRDNT